MSRNVAETVAGIKFGLAKELMLGNMEARRNCGYAGDYVNIIWLMLRPRETDDYLVATGESHSVTKLVETTFNHFGLDWGEYIVFDVPLYPAEIYELRGAARKARNTLG